MNLKQITTRCGQYIWLDSLSRTLIDSGQLKRYIEAGVSGLTSNPAIFQHAIATDTAYQSKFSLITQVIADPETRFETLVLPDIQDACDLFLPVYRESEGNTGFVSFEISPRLSHDPVLTFACTKRLWRMINRENVMIKIPATKAGIEAIELAISEGINVNVTLIFSPQQLYDVQNAYVRGICRRVAAALPVDHIASVASVFISRIDSAVDTMLADKAPHLQGKVAIAAAKMAYHHWQTEFLPDIRQLSPAKAQTLLWASTSVKNPAYPDLLYVDNLIGPDTVNTVPEAILQKIAESDEPHCMLSRELDQAQEVIREFEELGFDLNEIGAKLQQEGLAAFDQAYDKLMVLMSD